MAAAKIGFAAYGAALLIALVSAALVAGGLRNLVGSLPVGSNVDIFQLAILFVGMSYGSAATTSTMVLGTGVSMGIHFVPALTAAAGVAGAWFMSRRQKPRTAGFARVTVAVASALIFSVTMTLLGVLFPLRIGSSGFQIEFSSAGPLGFLVAAFLIALGTWLTLGGSLRKLGPIPNILVGACVYFVIVDAVLLLAGIVVAILNGPQALTAIPLAFAWATAIAMSVGMLGTLHAEGSVLFWSNSTSATGNGGDLGVFSAGMPSWALLLVLLCVLSALFASLALHLRLRSRNPSVIAVAAGVWAVLGLLIQGLGTFSISGAGVAVLAAPSSTTFLVFAAWGAAIGALSLYAGPVMAGLLPPGVVARIGAGPTAIPRAERGRVALDTDPYATSPSGRAQTAETSQVEPPADGAGSRAAGSGPGDIQEPGTQQPTAWEMPPVRPLSRKGKLVLVGGVTSLVVVILLAAITPIVRSGLFGPEKIVKSYFAALSNGDANAALQLSGQNAAAGQSVELLTNEIYGKATNRPHAAAIGHVSVAGDTAEVTVSYSLGSSSAKTTSLQLNRTATHWLIADEWTIVSGALLGQVSIKNSQKEARDVTANGVTLSSVSGSRMYAALPGTYTLLASATPWLEEETATLSVDQGSTFGIKGLANRAFKDQGTKLVTDAIIACAAKTDAYLPDCPFSLTYSSSSGGYGNVVYSVKTMPELTIQQSSGSSDLSISSTTPGKVTYSCDYAYFGSKQHLSGDQSFSVYATVVLLNGQLVLHGLS